MFKVAIVGGENIGDYKKYAEKCVYYLRNRTKDGITILSMGDKFNDVFASAANIDIKQYNVDWGRFGKNALKNRQTQMIEECDAVIAFRDGTKETDCFISLAKNANIPTRVVEI